MFLEKQMGLFKVLHYGVNKIYVLKGFLNSRIFCFRIFNSFNQWSSKLAQYYQERR